MIKPTHNSCGAVFTAECDECGDEIASECDSFQDAVDIVKTDGRIVNERPTYRGSHRFWRHYCSDCAADLDD